MNIFLSYNFRDERFVHTVYSCLRSQPGTKPFYYGEERDGKRWPQLLARKLRGCQGFVLFMGKRPGETQIDETNIAVKYKIPHRIVVLLRGGAGYSQFDMFGAGHDPIRVARDDEQHALICAREIVGRLRKRWLPFLDIPSGYPFDYEKRVIEEYVEGNGRLSRARIEEGYPAVWPTVQKEPAEKRNPVPEKEIGAFRLETASIVVDTRSGWRQGPSIEAKDLLTRKFTLPEAGPRKYLNYPNGGNLTVGILVSGGIAPGINAVIDGIVNRHTLYRNRATKSYRLTVKGYTEGFRSLLRPGSGVKTLESAEVRRQAELGGSMLGTSRVDELLGADPEQRAGQFKKMVQKLSSDKIEILYIIGGDGSLRAAHAISKLAEETGDKISVVGIPKTTDNDILWVWQSFGFLSAVERAREFILNLHTEVSSNPRLCVIQLFGSDSGFVVSHAALSSGVCSAALIPEADFTMEKLSSYVREQVLEKLHAPESGQNPYGMIVMAETAIPLDAKKYLRDRYVGLLDKERKAVNNFFANDRRISGQTPDELRAAGLKIVSRVLERDIREMSKQDDYWKQFRVFTNEPRHLLRSIRPSVSDLAFGERLGVLAVDNAMAGYRDFMVSQWVTEFVLVPLKLVTLGRKRVRKDGIFWKSVLASTGQPEDLT